VAAESRLRGACLLGEMPHIFARVPFPKAALAVLEAFTTIAGIQVDLTELAEQAKEVEEKLGELLEKVEQVLEEQSDETTLEEQPIQPEPAEEERLSPEDERHLEQLFIQARQDRSKAYELKRELDRLDLYKEYEDRFLDLFKKPA
jgi:hypothetical protein